MYQTVIAYDPEGLLGSIMAILTVYSGVLAGMLHSKELCNMTQFTVTVELDKL